jgi:hypothetical protein
LGDDAGSEAKDFELQLSRQETAGPRKEFKQTDGYIKVFDTL